MAKQLYLPMNLQKNGVVLKTLFANETANSDGFKPSLFCCRKNGMFMIDLGSGRFCFFFVNCLYLLQNIIYIVI